MDAKIGPLFEEKVVVSLQIGLFVNWPRRPHPAGENFSLHAHV